jgi:hypothetical protein
MTKKLPLIIALAAAGCSSKKQEPPPPLPAATVEAPKAVPQPAPPKPELPAAPTADAPPPNELSCDLILPQAIRDKYFRGLDIRPLNAAGPANAECEIAFPSGNAAVAVACNPTPPDAMDAAIKNRVERMHGKKIAAGMGGVLVSNTAGNQVMVWDDDSPCMARFQLPSSIDAVAFARDLLAVLPVK